MFDAGSRTGNQAPNGALAAVPGPVAPATSMAAGDRNLLFDAVVERLAKCMTDPGVPLPAALEVMGECVVALQKLRAGMAKERQTLRLHASESEAASTAHLPPR